MKQTPLTEVHRSLGARMVDFHGWEMPVQYTSVLEEHRIVRSKVGLFDLCHMGEFTLTGPEPRDPFMHYYKRSKHSSNRRDSIHYAHR